MFSTGPNYGKLKTNLRLTINRLKLLEKKKTELAQKARKEIADYIANGKYERAKIRVEHIIREDYLVEAMELVEMYCDLILARFGLIQQMKTLDEGLAEAISSLIWVTPRLQSDVAELKIISDQLTAKYGKPYALAARENALKTVNEKMVHKLSVQAPSRVLVEKYLIEIAKSHDVPYEPDESVLHENEAEAAEALANENTLIDFGGSNSMFPRPPPGDDNSASGGDGGMPFKPYITQPTSPPFSYPAMPEKPPGAFPPPLPTVPPSDAFPAMYPHTIGFNTPPQPPHVPAPMNGIDDSPAPPYDTVVGPSKPPRLIPVDPPGPTAAPRTKLPATDLLPELPSVPTTSIPKPDASTGKGSGEEIDFDDLTRRFEELKKRK